MLFKPSSLFKQKFLSGQDTDLFYMEASQRHSDNSNHHGRSNGIYQVGI